MGRVVSASGKKQAGFTTIELLIVVSVIGILACIAIPIFLDQKDTAIVGVTKANMEAMRSGLNQYVARSANNSYPTGSLNFFDFRSCLPEINLPPIESDAKIASGSFLYSSDGLTYGIWATSTNRTSERFRASPTGIYKY